MGAVSSTTCTLLPTQTGVLRALANEVALHFELDRFRAERIGDPQRRDEDRITRLLAQVVDLRATDEDQRGDGRDTAPPQALSRGYRADSGEPSRTDPSRAKSARWPEVKPGENLGPRAVREPGAVMSPARQSPESDRAGSSGLVSSGPA